ncbi:MAG: 2-oxoacid:acceptor oxidoreductase family protein, partial [Planctomycetota bacterium]
KERRYFTLGIDHPYAVRSDDTPSLLPEKAIAIRLHSIGGWGMITTGKNLGVILGDIGDFVSRERGEKDEFGQLKEAIHVSANPRYGSEKKGAPTAYFCVAAPERIRVNCDLRHVNVVLCCDPKAFTHFNPLDGMAEGGVLVFESSEEPDVAWTRIPQAYRQQIIDQKIRLYTLPGFDIAKEATDRRDLQLRMQGNAFLGAFFGVSTFLSDNDIGREHFDKIVRAQYEAKFGRFGAAVVESNMKVMTAGFERIREVAYGDVDAPDLSKMRGDRLHPLNENKGFELPTGCGGACQPERAPVQTAELFDSEFRADFGYDQPASPLSAVGMMAAATGRYASKRIARRETPVFIAENCTQCMACIAACPDTALPNTAQEISTVLATAVDNYVLDAEERSKLHAEIPALDERAREKMRTAVLAKKKVPFQDIVAEELVELAHVGGDAKQQLLNILGELPLAYSKVNAIFGTAEKKNPGTGGLFSIFVSDLCKGCGECVVECGDHDALRMMPDTEELNVSVGAASLFLDQLPVTDRKFLGLYNPDNPEESKAATLRNHLMQQDNYKALVSGDGACAGCGEKSVLRALASVTEAYMRPIYHRHADRMDAKANRLEQEGAARLTALAERNPEEFERFRKAVAHLILDLGGEDDADTDARIAAEGAPSIARMIEAMCMVMRQDAFNHRDLQVFEDQKAEGMSVMAMGASTGCNTVYGSTPPNNPHPYPWMNSLFQDGTTVSWMLGESVIDDHAHRSVLPERLCDALLDRDENVMTEEEYFELTHFSDTFMTDQEIRELPKVWCVGGDGALGDIGFQNLSKTVLQNRPNVKVLLLDTQVYSNTGGQNSDSTPMLGGGDMNQIGAATEGKLVEKKSVAEILTAGHGSPFVAQISMADQPNLYKAILDGLEYRGTAFFQTFTTCQPEHGVADDMSTVQAVRIRDSRGMPQFVFDPQNGETYTEALDLKRNPESGRDWKTVRASGDVPAHWYTVAQWAATEARFRRHLKRVKSTDGLIHLDDILVGITQSDIVKRRYLDKKHRAFVPDFGVYAHTELNGKPVLAALSKQLVLFCVERRKAWRMLQSKAGVANPDYKAQQALLKRMDAGELSIEDVHARGRELLMAEVEAQKK